MNGNETLLAPEPVDILAAALPEEDATYTFERADGTIERAMSAEDAIARCPVLGKLAIESPDKANLLLQLAALGKEKMQADELQKESIPLEKPKDEQKLEPEPKVDMITGKAKPVKREHRAKTDIVLEQTQPNPTDEYVAPLHPAGLREDNNRSVVATEKVATVIQKKPEQIIEIRQEPMAETHIRAAKDEAYIEQQQSDAFVRYHEHSTVQEKESTVRYTPEIRPLSEGAPNKIIAMEAVADPPTEYKEPLLLLTPVIALEKIQQIQGPTDTKKMIDPSEFASDIEIPFQADPPQVDTLTLPLAEIAEVNPIHDMSRMPRIFKAELDEQLDLQSEPEVIDAYRELLVPPQDQEFRSDMLVVAAALPAETTQYFEPFLTPDLQVGKIIPLESIILRAADKQPLEQTLIQLGYYLSNSPQEAQTVVEKPDSVPESKEQHITNVRAILQDITELLSDRYSLGEEVGAQSQQLTPELTEKLLLLLQASGYEHPKEILIEFVHIHGLAYLLQTVHRMCSLNSNENQQEFLSSSIQMTQNDDYARIAIGKLLFGLILRLHPGY